MPTPVPRTLEKAFKLFHAILTADGSASLETLARRANVPPATAHRLVSELRKQGFVMRERPGRYVAGPGLAALAGTINEARLWARISRPYLASLARKCRQTAHFGVFEHGMVTYLVKESEGPAAAFTRENMQLEAYCSGIGKVLLAHLPTSSREAYLSEGPFVALTPSTIVDPAALRLQLETIRTRQWACDDAEMIDDLKCLAVPLARADGHVVAAISLSAPAGAFTPAYRHRAITDLMVTRRLIEARLAIPGPGSARGGSIA